MSDGLVAVSLDSGTLGCSVLPYETGIRRLLLAELDEILCENH